MTLAANLAVGAVDEGRVVLSIVNAAAGLYDTAPAPSVMEEMSAELRDVAAGAWQTVPGLVPSRVGFITVGFAAAQNNHTILRFANGLDAGSSWTMAAIAASGMTVTRPSEGQSNVVWQGNTFACRYPNAGFASAIQIFATGPDFPTVYDAHVKHEYFTAHTV